jgi:hypothetical protein
MLAERRTAVASIVMLMTSTVLVAESALKVSARVPHPHEVDHG